MPPTPENPFDMNPKPIDFSPSVTTDQLSALQAAIDAGSVKPEDADKAVKAMEEAIAKKRSASETISMVTGILKGVVGLIK